MSFYLSVILAFSIFLPSLLAVARYDYIHPSYRPFLYLLWVGSLNELLSFLLLMNHIPNFVNNNIYSLIGSTLIVLFFRNFSVLQYQGKIFHVILSILLLSWIIDNLVLNKFFAVSIYFQIIYSFIIVLLSISNINVSLLDTRSTVLNNPDFLISAAFIIYYTYKILIEMFWLYGINTSGKFQLLVYDILNYINLFCNLIFMFAVLWMPKKQVFTMRS